MLTIKHLKEKFDLKLLAGEEKQLDREIKSMGFNRAGLELSGFFFQDKLRRVVTLGNKEFQYVSQLPHATKMERYETLMADKDIPCIILTKKFKDKEDIVKVGKKMKFLILETDQGMGDAWQTIGNYVIDSLKTYVSYHGTLINVYGEGVFITGESGIGKSEVTLELIKRGHMFIGDDAIDIAPFSGKLRGRANERVGKFLEVRGLGILNVKRMFGVELIQNSTTIGLTIQLATQKRGEEFDRLGLTRDTKEFQGISVPYYKLPVKAGRSLADLIEMTVIEHKMRKDGYISGEDFLEHSKVIDEKELKENVK